MKRTIVLGIVAVIVLALIGGGLWWLRQNSGSRLLVKANLAIRANRLDKALDLANQYVSSNPKDWQGYFTQAEAHMAAGSFDEARKCLATAQELKAGESTIVIAQAETYRIPAHKDAASNDLAVLRKAGDAYGMAVGVLEGAKVADEKGTIDVRQRLGTTMLEQGRLYQKLGARLNEDAVAAEAKRDTAARDALRAESKAVGTKADEALDKAKANLLAVVTADPTRGEAATSLVQLCLQRHDEQSLAQARKAILGSPQMPAEATVLIVMEDLRAATAAQGPGATDRERLAEAAKVLDQVREKHPEDRPVKIARADLAVRLNDLKTAQTLCDEVLKGDAKNPQGRLLAVQLLALGGNTIEAEKKLAELVKDAPGWLEAQFLYARLAMRNGRPNVARDAMAAVAKADANSTSAKLMQAEMASSLMDLSAAKRLTEEVLATEPGNPYARLIHATVLMESGNLDQAEKELSALRKDNPRWPEAAIAAAQLAAQRGDGKAALAAAEDAAKLDPSSEVARTMRTELLLRYGDGPAALQGAQEVFQAHPDNPTSLRMLVAAAVRAGQSDLARQTLEKAVAQNQAKPEMLMAAADGYLSLQDRPSALKAAQAAAACKPATASERIMIARALVMLDRSGEAEKLIGDELRKDPNQPALRYELGRICATTGRMLQAIDHYRAATDLQKDNTEYRLTLARALLDSGDIAESRKVLDSIDSSEPMANAMRLQVRLIQGENVGLDQMLQSGQGSARSAVATALPFLARGQLKQCVDFCEAELARNPDDVELRLLLGRAYLMMGQSEKGAQQWEKTLQLAPERLSTYLELVSILTRDNAPEQVTAKLSGVPGAQKDLVDLALGAMLASSGDFQKALPLLRDVAGRASAPEHVRGRAAAVLAQTLAAMGQTDAAVAEFERLKATPAWRKQAVFGTAQVLAMAGRSEQAAAALAEATQIAQQDKDSSLLRNIAELYVRMGKSDQALPICDMVAKLNPDDSRTYLLRAAVLGSSQKGAEAIECYRKALDLQSGNFSLYVVLAQALDAQQRPTEALEVLHRLEALGPAGESVAAFQRGMLFAGWGLSDQAAESCGRLAGLGHAGSPQVELALGRAFAALGQPQKAAEYLTPIPVSATEYVPARLLLAGLAATPDARLAAIRKLGEARPGNSEVLQQEMIALSNAGQFTEAVKTFQSFVGQYAKAKTLPEDLAFIATQAMLESSDRPAARALAQRMTTETNLTRWRQVATILAMDDPQAAADLLPALEKADACSALLGFCMAVQAKDQAKAAAYRDRFVQVTREGSKSPSLDASHRLLLALAQGDAAAAKAEMAHINGIYGYGRIPATELLAAASNPRIAAEALGLLKASVALNMGLPSLSRGWAKDLLQARPTCQWAAAIALACNQNAPAQREILAMIRPADGHMAQMASARELQKAQDYAKASQAFAQLMQNDDSPEIMMAAGSALECAGKAKEALALYQQVYKTLGAPDAANSAAYMLLQINPHDAAAMAEAKDLADKAIAARPGEAGYLDTLGWIDFLQERYEPAADKLLKAVKGAPRIPQIHYHLGMAEAACGRLEMARWHLTACVNLANAMKKQGVSAPAEIVQVAVLAEQALAALGPAQ